MKEIKQFKENYFPIEMIKEYLISKDIDMIYYQEIGSVAIRFKTKYSYWIIELQEDDTYYLYHKNVRHQNYRGCERFPGYHFQKKSNSVYHLIKYADNHDKYKPLVTQQSNRIDELFNQIL